MENKKVTALVKQQCPNVKLIYLFGSRANDQHTKDSDWDIAILNDHKLTVMEKWQIKENLANKFHTEVDFIDLLDTTTVLQLQVVEYGKLIFDSDNFSPYFEMQTLGMYSYLQESRQHIIDNFVWQVREKAKKYELE